jgi:hypothetical protein
MKMLTTKKSLKTLTRIIINIRLPQLKEKVRRERKELP